MHCSWSSAGRIVLIVFCLMTLPAQATGTGAGLGVATSESPLVVNLPAAAPPPGQALYLRLDVEMLETAALHPPRVSLILDSYRDMQASDVGKDGVIGIISIFPWPWRDKEPIRASFNLSQAVERLAGRLGIPAEALYARLRIAVQVTLDPRDSQLVRVRASNIAVSTGQPTGRDLP